MSNGDPLNETEKTVAEGLGIGLGIYALLRLLPLIILGTILVIILILAMLFGVNKFTTRRAGFSPGCTSGMCGIPGYTRQRSVLQNMLEMTPLTWNDSH